MHHSNSSSYSHNQDQASLFGLLPAAQRVDPTRTTVFVGNLPFEIDEGEVHEWFTEQLPSHTVAGVRMLKKKDTGKVAQRPQYLPHVTLPISFPIPEPMYTQPIPEYMSHPILLFNFHNQGSPPVSPLSSSPMRTARRRRSSSMRRSSTAARSSSTSQSSGVIRGGGSTGGGSAPPPRWRGRRAASSRAAASPAAAAAARRRRRARRPAVAIAREGGQWPALV